MPEEISAWHKEEIRRKAEHGEELLKPTAAKQAYYDRKQAVYRQLTIDKARAGEDLMRPNDWKDSIYQDARMNSRPQDAVYYDPDVVGNRNDRRMEGQMSALDRYMQQWGEGSMASQDAILSQTRDAQIAELQKALEDAVAEGKISTREAERQFESNKKVIEEQAYVDSEATNAAAQSRGIQNSSQMLGLMQGDQSRMRSMINENMTTRDARINDIKDRIDAIKNKSAIDISTANATYGYGKAAAQGNIDAQVSQQMFQAMMQQYMQNNQHIQGLEQMGAQNKFQHGVLDKQQTHDLDILDRQQGHDLDILGKQQQHDFGILDKQHKNQLGVMDKQQAMTLEQFAVQHGYNLETMSHQDRITLGQMAVQQGYNITNMDKQFGHDKEMLNMQQSWQSSENGKNRNHDMNMMAQQHANSKDARESEYNFLLGNELAKRFDPGSDEYRIEEDRATKEYNQWIDSLTIPSRIQASYDYYAKNGIPTDPGPKPKKSDYEKSFTARFSRSWLGKAMGVKPAHGKYYEDLEKWEIANSAYQDYESFRKSYTP